MTPLEVEDLMMGSASAKQWAENAEKVKAAFGGKYPDFWYEAIVQSGIMGLVRQSWRV